MRNVKFRAWDFSQEVMIDDARFVIEANGTVWWRPYVEHEDCISEMMEKAYDNIEIMQFTGLFDKNGVEIYEGDIVSQKYQDGVFIEPLNFIGEIKYSRDKFVIDNGSQLHSIMSHCEVIGNIYENPELLEH